MSLYTKKELSEQRALTIKKANEVVGELKIYQTMHHDRIIDLSMSIIQSLIDSLKETTEQARIDELRFIEKMKAKPRAKIIDEDWDLSITVHEPPKKEEVKTYRFKEMLDKI